MKILIDLTSLADNFSGIELYAMSVAKELIKNQDTNYILVFKNNIHKAFLDEYTNVEKIVVKGGNKLLFNQIVFPWRLHKIKADRYLFMAYTEPFFWFKSNTINAIHDVSCWDCPGSNKKHMILYWKLMFWKVAKRKGKILTVSNFSKNRINCILGIDLSKIYVTYSAPLETTKIKADDEAKQKKVKEKYGLPDGYILCLSTLEPRKNLKFFLEAYAEVLKKVDRDMNIVLAGRKGWMVDDLLNYLPIEVKEKILFIGFVDDEDLPYIYKMASFFAFPSLYEGFGVPPLEALSQGTPVLVTNTASMPEVLGNAAIYYEKNNKSDLIDKIMYMLNMDGEQKRRCLCEVENVLEKFSWSDIGADVLSVCRLP